MGHTLRGEHIQEEKGKVGNPKFESVPTVEELIQ
jgi:hypothetical protein